MDELNKQVELEDGAKPQLTVSAYRFVIGFNAAKKTAEDLALEASYYLEFPDYLEKKADGSWDRRKAELEAEREKRKAKEREKKERKKREREEREAREARGEKIGFRDDEEDDDEEKTEEKEPKAKVLTKEEQRKQNLQLKHETSAYTRYAGFMIPGELERNRLTIWQCLYAKGEELEKFCRERAGEILRFEFSRYMENPVWAGENAGKLCDMLQKVESFQSLLFQRNPGKYGLSEEEEQLLRSKIDQASALKSMLQARLDENGVSYSGTMKNYEVKKWISPKMQSDLNDPDGDYQKSVRRFQGVIRSEQERFLEANGYTGEDHALYQPRQKPIEREQLSAEIQKLSFTDFVQTVGEKNRGQVEVSDGKLTIVNNGFFKRNRIGAAKAEHVEVKKRFVEVALSNLNVEDQEAYRPYLYSMVGLVGYETETKPLTRKQIADVVQEIESHPSLVKQAAISQSDERIRAHANKVLNYFGEPVKKTDRWYVKKRKRNAIRNKIRTVLMKVRKNNELISEDRLNTLVNKNMDALLDEIFRSVMRAENIAWNLTGQGITDMDSNAPACLELFAREAILKLAAGTEGASLMADYRLNETICTTAFQEAGREDILKAMENAVISGFTGGTEESFLKEVAALQHRFLGKETDPEILEGLGAFTLLINETEKLRNYHSALLQRTAGEPAFTKDELIETASRIEALMEDNKESFERVSATLSHTRFAEGYEELKTKMENGEFSAENEEKIAEALFTKHDDRSGQPLLAEKEAFRALNGEEEQLYRSLSGEEKQLADILLLRSEPSAYLKRPDDENTKNIVNLLYQLKHLKTEGGSVMLVRFGKTKGRLTRAASGRLTLTLGKTELPLPMTVKGLSDSIELDMCDNPEIYGYENLYRHIFKEFDYRDLSLKYRYSDFSMIGEMDHDRQLATRMVLKIDSRIKGAAFLENTSLENLMDLAREHVKDKLGIIDPMVNIDDKLNMVIARQEMLNKKYINGTQTLHYMQLLERTSKDAIPVRLMERDGEEEDETKEKWTEEERRVRNFIADIYLGFTPDWDADQKGRSDILVEHQKHSAIPVDIKRVEETTKGDYYQATLLRNIDTLRLLINSEDLSLLTRTVERMSLPSSKEGQADLKKELLQSFKNGLTSLTETLGLKGLTNEEIRDKLTAEENKDRLAKAAAGFDEQIKKGMTACADAVQEEMTAAAKAIFDKKSTDAEPIDLSAQDLNARNLTEEERQRRLAIHNRELNRRIEEAVRGDGGQGSFLKEVLSHYFVDSDEVEKRNMVASLIRGAVPKTELPENATEEEKAEEEIRKRGQALSGYLKGAGPLLQKILQGIPEQGMPPVLRVAVKDMKSKLSPISDEVVRARLLAMIERSEGEITSIDVERSLGAASIGQAFLCRLYGPHLPKEGKEAVIKLLRPEARNRMAREKDIFQNVATEMDRARAQATGAEIVSDNRESLDSQTKALLAELDLTIEADYARMGTVYNNGTNVQSVGVSNLITPTTNAMVLEKAPGTTVDRYQKETKAKMNAIMKAWNAGTKSAEECRTELLTELSRLERRQGHLADVAAQWVNEAIYGHGFYHGDMHSGNIMIDDEKATVIDFGNATKLTEEQKGEIIKLTAATAAGEVDDFMDAFNELLSPSGKQQLRQNRNAMREEVRAVFRIGNRESAGLRISLLLMKAQALNIRVPAVISGFSSSQIRIQNSVDELNSLIGDMKDNLARVEAAAGVTLTKVEQEKRNTKPKQFFTVMTDVLLRNMGVSLKRLGFWKGIKYKWKLS
ncbi:MAG: phosphotransferase [Lachnospiraceae bacterium]|nr:phosphotransferase [Lachnospiraceae bacterium]